MRHDQKNPLRKTKYFRQKSQKYSGLLKKKIVAFLFSEFRSDFSINFDIWSQKNLMGRGFLEFKKWSVTFLADEEVFQKPPWGRFFVKVAFIKLFNLKWCFIKPEKFIQNIFHQKSQLTHPIPNGSSKGCNCFNPWSALSGNQASWTFPFQK